MNIKMLRQKGRVQLVFPHKDALFVLASMTLMEGTGCWIVIDQRLKKTEKASPYSGGLHSDVFNAHCKPENAEERELVISLLREYHEDKDGLITWCTYDGVVKGHPSINGYTPAGRNPAGFFDQDEALEFLREAKKFWSGYEGNPDDVRLENPNRQPSATDVTFTLSMLRYEKKRDESAPLPP